MDCSLEGPCIIQCHKEKAVFNGVQPGKGRGDGRREMCIRDSPETAEGRLAIARKIVETARTDGIDRKDIVVDALTMTVSSDKDAAKTTLDALAMIKEQLGVKTILGAVSYTHLDVYKRQSTRI